MTAPPGLLIQSYAKVRWDSLDLSYHEMPDGKFESLVHSVEVTFDKGEQAPAAKFRFNANPEAFKVMQLIKQELLDKTFTIEMGYVGGNKFVTSYRYAGMRLTTGHDPKLEIMGVSVIKGAWTDNKISYTMEKAMSLYEFPQWLLSQHSPNMKDVLKFVWVGNAAEKAKAIQVKGNQVQRTCHNILVDVLRVHGFDVQLGDTAFDGTIVISASPGFEGELEKDKPSALGSAAKPGKRNVWVVGPGLMENLTRDQSYNLGQLNTERSASPTSPSSTTVQQASVVQKNSAPQESAAKGGNKVGSTGQANPSSSETGTVKGDGDAEKLRAAFSKLLTTKISFTFEMLPAVVGMKPRDLMVVPSLKGPGDYLEDWELSTVTYKQDLSGGIRIGGQGRRAYTGEQSMIDDATQEEVRGVISEFATPEDWTAFYWAKSGKKQAMPLAS